MPWFVAKRALADKGGGGGKYEYRVFSEAEIESIEPEWDWASGACDSQEEALREAEDKFWEDFE